MCEKRFHIVVSRMQIDFVLPPIGGENSLSSENINTQLVLSRETPFKIIDLDIFWIGLLELRKIIKTGKCKN